MKINGKHVLPTDTTSAIHSFLLHGDQERIQNTQTHKRQRSSTQTGERKPTHRGRERQGQHAHKGEGETRGEADYPGGRRSRSKTCGMRYWQPGERSHDASGPAKRGLSEERTSRKNWREIGTQLGSSFACRTTTNTGLERCSGCQKVYSILVGRADMDFGSTRLNRLRWDWEQAAVRIVVSGARPEVIGS